MYLFDMNSIPYYKQKHHKVNLFDMFSQQEVNLFTIISQSSTGKT